MMQTITHDQIASLRIPIVQFNQWVKEAFMLKSQCSLPHKISQTFDSGRCFFNTMPCIIFPEKVYGVKIVSRYPGRNPSITADILIYSLENGELLAKLDGTWITSARTGAVAALAAATLARNDAQTYAVMGLGATGQAFLDSFAVNPAHYGKTIKLLRYKDHALVTRQRLLSLGFQDVRIVDDVKQLIQGTDVLVSAVTVAENLIGDLSWFEPGCLIIPIHTRGFQNCDIAFDKVLCDDIAHVENFKNFHQFKDLTELGQVLTGECTGRSNDQQRLLSYNIGIAVHDILIAKRILSMFDIPNLPT